MTTYTHSPLRRAHQASAMQRQFWWEQQARPSSAAYNIPCAFLLEGQVDSKRFADGVRRCVQDWEVLHCGLHLSEGQLMQCLDSEAEPMMRWHHLPASSRDAFERLLLPRIEHDAREPFDIGATCLLRMEWYASNRPDLSAVLLTIHHAVIDLFSKERLCERIAALYHDPDAQLPDDEAGYCAFSDWQREWLASDAEHEQELFWREQLANCTPELCLPLEVDEHTSEGPARRVFTLPEPVTQELWCLCREQTVRPFVILLAAWAAQIGLQSGCRKFAIGVPMSNRREPTFASCFGCLMNILPVPVHIEPEQDFLSLLRQVRQHLLMAHRHQELPIERIVAALRPPRSGHRNPLYQVGFTHEPMPHLDIAGVRVQPLDVDLGDAQLEYFMRFVHIDSETISGQLEFQRTVCNEQRAARMVAGYQALLADALRHPNTPLSQLDCMGPEERLQLQTWNQTERNYSLRSLPAAFDEQAARTPNAIALRSESEGHTYAEFQQRIHRLSRALVRAGVEPGDRVVVCLRRGVDLIVAAHAAVRIGAVYVPMDPDAPEERLGFQLQDVEPAACVCAVDSLIPVLKRLEIAVLDPRHLPADSAIELPPYPDLDDLAYIMYTSGSTGRPKGVCNGHRGIANRLCWMQEAFPLQHGEVVLCKTPATFDVSIWELFWPVQVGATLAIAPDGAHHDPWRLFGIMRQMQVSTIHFVPAMLEAFLTALPAPELPLLRRVICSGEALSRNLAARFFEQLSHVELHNLYGPTEAAIDVSHWHCRPQDQRSLIPIGHPIANTTLHVLNEAGQPVPIGVAGEIFIGGVQVAQGYWRRPELTAERFVSMATERLYRTGDVGRIEADGALLFGGRMDFQVKIRGNRVELGEIEVCLQHLAGVREAVACVQSGARGEPRLIAFVTGNDGFSEASLRVGCRQVLPGYMVPQRIVRLPEMPLMGNGKIDRKALPFVAVNGSRVPRHHAEYSGTLARLHALMAKVLGFDDFGPEDNFMDIGGDSIGVIVLAGSVQEEFGKNISVTDILRSGSMLRIAELLDGSDEALVSARERGRRARQASLNKRRWR